MLFSAALHSVVGLEYWKTWDLGQKAESNASQITNFASLLHIVLPVSPVGHRTALSSFLSSLQEAPCNPKLPERNERLKQAPIAGSTHRSP